MPRTKKLPAKITRQRPETGPAVALTSESGPLTPPGTLSKRLPLAIGLVILLAALLFLKKDWFVAAVVNGQPISRISLEQSLDKQYGSQTLDNLINQTVIEQELSKAKVQVTDKMVSDEVTQVTATLPQGYTLDQALALQGMDKSEFLNQVKLQLGIDQLLSSQSRVSDTEIDQYIATNASEFKDSSPSAARSTAANVLKRQKTSQAFSDWFAGVKSKSSILKFL